MSTELKHLINSDGVIFSFENLGKIIPVNQWSTFEKSGSSWLIGLVQSDSENVKANEYNIFVSSEKIAEMPNIVAEDLCLPEMINAHLHILHNGIISQPQFNLSYKWLKDARGREISAAERVGCFLKINDKPYRLPYQLFKIAECIDLINATSSEKIHDRLLAINNIENFLSQDTFKSITIDGYLNSTKIFFASALELNVKETDNGIDFDPVLMRSHKLDDLEFSEDEIGFENVLIPEDREKFINLFRKYSDCQANYSLGPGKYIVLDSNLYKALSIVRKIQEGSAEKKLEFLKNPKAVLAEAGIPEEMLKSILSDRIEGYGERLIKVIPWIKIEGQDWFPTETSTCGLKIDGRDVSISVAEYPDLVEEVSNAIQNGEEYVEFKNERIPATRETLSKIGELFPVKPENLQKVSNTKVENNRKNYVLYVKDNLSNIKYHRPRLEKRINVVPFEASPLILKSSLATYPHQREGVKWLVENFRAGVRGVLLADDMGLGKTFQALTFLAWLRERMISKQVSKRPILIIAPTGLLKNWEKEHNDHLHTPGLGSVLLAYGSGLKNIRDITNTDALVKPLNIQKIKEADWILTTYETLSNHQTSFAGVHYGAVIFDEMQKIKTPNARITEAAQAIESDFFIGMTGTPIENRLADLWCLIDTLQPGRFGTLQQFSIEYEKDDSTSASVELRSELTEAIDNTPPIMCRRMKADTLSGLPDLVTHYEVETMPKAQAEAYTQISDEITNSTKPGRHLEALQRLRSLVLHPNDYCSNYSDDAFIAESARLIATFRILDQIYKKKEKVLIFIELRKWHQVDFFPSMLRRRYKLERDPMSITGQIKAKDRQDRVDLFQKEDGVFDVLLLSPRAAGVGLTLTKANHVIHLSRWWNPAVEDQCTDRAYRIGQTKKVHVYYPMAKHPEFGVEKSFDFNLDKLLIRKRELSRKLLVHAATGDELMDLCINSTTKGKVTPFQGKNLEDIKCMEWRQFQDWVSNECKKAGLLPHQSQDSWDGGADILIKSIKNKIIGIIQCKHSVQEEVSYTAVDDLLRAKEAYNAPEAKLIAVTNAPKFSKPAQTMANHNHHQISLIAANQLLQVGGIIRDML